MVAKEKYVLDHREAKSVFYIVTLEGILWAKPPVAIGWDVMMSQRGSRA